MIGESTITVKKFLKCEKGVDEEHHNYTVFDSSSTLTGWWRLAKGREEKTSGVRPNTKSDRCLHRPPEFVVSRLSSRVFFRGICLPACLPPRFVVSVRSGRWIHVILIPRPSAAPASDTFLAPTLVFLLLPCAKYPRFTALVCGWSIR